MVSVSSSLMRFAYPAGVRAGLSAGEGASPPTSPLAFLPPAESASERARARLEEIKDRLKAMERMGFPAEVVSRMAAVLGTEAARSASQLGAGSPTTTDAPPVAGAAVAPGAGDAGLEADTGVEADDDAATGMTSLPGAYRDALDGRASAAPSDDAAIRREFEALAARIRALQQRAEREAARLAR